MLQYYGADPEFSLEGKTAVITGGAAGIGYETAKGGIIAMTKVMALEWGKYGIRVNAVAPTVVLTELGHKAWDGPAGDAFKKEMPSERFAEPDEVAGVIAFLCSNAAGMITGHNLLIDGGYTIK